MPSQIGAEFTWLDQFILKKFMRFTNVVNVS